jgi:16S rRNA (adenine1518-N6/adenine1519-N6)-dimethyltransferase
MRARKKFGQHFLEAAWAEKLIDAIDPRPDERFVEIGPGPGALTTRLAARAGHVTAVEIDPEMVAELKPRLPANVEVVHADFLDFDLASIAHGVPFRVAGNLPYNVSSPILFKLLETAGRAPLVDATLMVQREVADRIAGRPGTKEYGTLSIFVQLRADVERLLALPPGAFRPAPKVHSSVLRLTFREPSVRIADEDTFERMVRWIFTQRRKTLANAIKRFAEERQMDARDAIRQAGLDGVRRPETLQLTELAQLADVFVSTI